MTTQSRQRHLARLRADANRALRGLAKPRILSPASSPALSSAGPSRARAAPEPSSYTPASANAISLDDERSIRALAKQIKRLIAEDRRRGLGVGG